MRTETIYTINKNSLYVKIDYNHGLHIIKKYTFFHCHDRTYIEREILIPDITFISNYWKKILFNKKIKHRIKSLQSFKNSHKKSVDMYIITKMNGIE
jgi:hypothetical protein